MKKFLFASCAVLLAAQAWGNVPSDKYNSKIENLDKARYPITSNYRSNVYFFGGFDFGGYKRTDPSLKELTAGEVRAIQNGVANRVTPHGNQPYSIIGYSQGGLRALGYISQVPNPNLIDAAVTVSGIDQGLKMLDGGLGAFKARGSGKINIVWNGLIAGANVFNFTPVLNPSILLRNQGSLAADIVFSIIPPSMRTYWQEAWLTTDPNRVPQIGDMIPGSAYIRDNVVKNENYTYRVKTGTRLTTEWHSRKIWPGITIWYLWIGYVDVYGYVSVNKSLPQFNPNVPVGFIGGTNNKTLTMADGNEKAVRDVVKGLEIGFAVVEGIHIAKCVFIIGLFNGSAIYAYDADRARRFMGNIDGEIYDIIGSSQGDGLVALSHQHLPQWFTEPDTGRSYKVLPNRYLGFEKVHANHQKITDNRDTWEHAGKMLIDGRDHRRR